MKKILLIPIALLALGACTNEVDEVFDTSASDRLNGRMLECQQLLTAPEHGWTFVYYPSPTQQFGGSTYMAKFDADGNVAVTGDVVSELDKNASEVITSHYSIKSSSSVVLTFDTYNDYIHHWSDPDPYYGNAWEGDFEFEYVGGDESRMVFRGTKTQNEIVFTALGEDIVAAAQKVIDMRTKIAEQLFATFDWNDGSEAVTLYDDDNYSVMTHYTAGDTEGEYELLPYAYTEKGLSFYKPVTIGGVTAQEFEYVDGGKLVAVDGKDESGNKKDVSLTGAHCENFVHYDDLIGNYTLNCSGVAPFNGSMANLFVGRASLREGKRLKTLLMDRFGSAGGYYRQGMVITDYPLELTYRKSDCSLSLTTQYLGELNGYYLYLCPWDSESGYLTWADGIGMTLTPTEKDGKISFTFADNGVWGGNIVSGFLYYLFSGTPSGETTAGYAAQLYNFSTMTKKN